MMARMVVMNSVCHGFYKYDLLLALLHTFNEGIRVHKQFQGLRSF